LVVRDLNSLDPHENLPEYFFYISTGFGLLEFVISIFEQSWWGFAPYPTGKLIGYSTRQTSWLDFGGHFAAGEEGLRGERKGGR